MGVAEAESENEEPPIIEDKQEALETSEPAKEIEKTASVAEESLPEIGVPESPTPAVEEKPVIETPVANEDLEDEIKEENLSISDEVGIPPSDLDITSSD